MAVKSKEERAHDRNMLILGFIFTGVIGTLITFLFQHLEDSQKIDADKRSESVRIMDKRRKQATTVFNELSPLMDTRWYNWRRLAWGLEDRIPEDSLKKRYAEYEDV